VQLVRAAATRALGDLAAQARTAEAAGDDERWLQAASGMALLKAELEIMQEAGVNQTPPRPVIEAADRLLGWLQSRRGEGA
jgi:hypothetical protein